MIMFVCITKQFRLVTEGSERPKVVKDPCFRDGLRRTLLAISVIPTRKFELRSWGPGHSRVTTGSHRFYVVKARTSFRLASGKLQAAKFEARR